MLDYLAVDHTINCWCWNEHLVVFDGFFESLKRRLSVVRDGIGAEGELLYRAGGRQVFHRMGCHCPRTIMLLVTEQGYATYCDEVEKKTAVGRSVVHIL